jgi:hypothetical protein
MTERRQRKEKEKGTGRVFGEEKVKKTGGRERRIKLKIKRWGKKGRSESN